MHHANHFYGHANIMASYAGLPEPPRIWGYLQHGWNILDGFAHGTNFAPGMPGTSDVVLAAMFVKSAVTWPGLDVDGAGGGFTTVVVVGRTSKSDWMRAGTS